MSNDRKPGRDFETFESATKDQAGHIVSSKAPPPVGPYPHARQHGDLLFLSGVGPRKPGTNEIPGTVFDAQGNLIEEDVRVQTESVIENIRAILEEAGSSLEQVIDVQVFLTNMKRDFKAFNEVYKKHFENIGATRTTIEVSALPTPICVEFKVIASVRRPSKA